MVEHPADYRWSSYHSNGLGEYEPVLTPHPIYLALGNTNQERQAAYQALFDDQMDTQGLTEIRDSLNQCRVLGGQAFKDQIEKTLSRRIRPGEAGRPRKDSKN